MPAIIRAVLSVVDKANFKQVQEWKEDEDMASLLYEARTEGMQQGMQRGMQQGMQRGMQQGIQQVAIGMLKANKLSVNEISMYSGLSVEEVEMLADKINNNPNEFV